MPAAVAASAPGLQLALATANELHRYAQSIPLCLGFGFSRWRLLYGDPANRGYIRVSTRCGVRLDCSSCHRYPGHPWDQLDAASCLWCGRARRSDVPGYLRHVCCLRRLLPQQILREPWPPHASSHRARVGRRLLACRGSAQLGITFFYPRRYLPAAVAAGALGRGRHAASATVAAAGTCPVRRERERDLVALAAVAVARFVAVATTAFVTAFATVVAATVSAVAAVTAAAVVTAVAAALAASTSLEPAGHTELRHGMQRDDVRRPERSAAV